jgi:hypothetical protein
MATTCLALRGIPSPADAFGDRAGTLAGTGRGAPPGGPRTASGFSGRRFCRIYPSADAWVLEKLLGGWAASKRNDNRKLFPTLTAAILYAVANGFSYRVVHSPCVSDAESLTGDTLPFAKNFSRGIDHRGGAPNS